MLFDTFVGSTEAQREEFEARIEESKREMEIHLEHITFCEIMKSAQNSIFESIMKSGRIFKIFDFLAKFDHLREKGKKRARFAQFARK